jgi:hypothetical protein
VSRLGVLQIPDLNGCKLSESRTGYDVVQVGRSPVFMSAARLPIQRPFLDPWGRNSSALIQMALAPWIVEVAPLS